MFTESFLLAILTSTLVLAAPQVPPFAQNGTFPPFPAETSCATSYSTSTYTIASTIPVVDTKTVYINSTTTIDQVYTMTSTSIATTVITTSTPTCITTSYPVQIWVTKVIDTYSPVLVTESCTETSTYLSTSCKTVATAVPSVTSCTEYSTSLSTGIKVATSTTCTPCAK